MRLHRAKTALSISVVVLVLIQITACAEPEYADMALPASQENSPSPTGEPVRVDTKGVTASIAYEAPLGAGFLQELEGKYKLRITEIVIAPGGYVGDHNHLGPGIRQVTSGVMAYVMPDSTVTYGPGDYFFETGNVSHRAENRTSEPNTHFLFEILPVEVKGPSLIPPRDGPVQ